MYLDGFAVVERLRAENPEAFNFVFSPCCLACQCFDSRLLLNLVHYFTLALLLT